MQKSTKGAAAAIAAGVLLLGGAGSLAYWSASVNVGGGSFNSGQMSLTDTTGASDSCDDAPWVFDSGEVEAAKTWETGDLLVPGDVLTKECTFDLTAKGEHLRATLAATGGTASGDLASALTVDSSFTVADDAVSEITEANDGDEVKATIEVTFNGGSEDNTTQDLAAALSDYTIVLTQAHS